MNQDERRRYLIDLLASERRELAGIPVPGDPEAQKQILRALFNLREPGMLSAEAMKVQDDYLSERIKEMGVTRFKSLKPSKPHMYMRRGDIVTLACDAIVNAANSSMTGCWTPNHACIDNNIHTFAGVQLRWECDQMVKEQGHLEPAGRAKITSAYNLPSKYVIHTVGPIIDGMPDGEHRALLARCYESCYRLAKIHGVKSLAFCCISTGSLGFPSNEAAQIAVSTIAALQAADSKPIDVVFNVTTPEDFKAYRDLLQ